MTKKHFIALADAVKEYNDTGIAGELPYSPFNEAQIEVLADFCQSQNTNFNRERWLAYIAGECGPNGGRR